MPPQNASTSIGTDVVLNSTVSVEIDESIDELCSVRSTRSTTSSISASNVHIPIVLIGGFLAPKKREHLEAYWGHALTSSGSSRVILVSPSSVASIHDRVCEIFYEMKGGKTDYGAEHSTQYGHAQYGKEHERGLYEEWDEKHPIHVVGHSYGGLTARVLQYYLDAKLFPGYNTSAAWIRSVTGISAPLNGSLSVYGLGADKENPVKTNPFSPGSFLGRFVHFYEYLDSKLLRNSFYDFGMEHWHVSWRDGAATNFWNLISKATGAGRFCEQEDNGAYELTVHSAMRWNKLARDSDQTYYFSFVGNRHCEERHPVDMLRQSGDDLKANRPHSSASGSDGMGADSANGANAGAAAHDHPGANTENRVDTEGARYLSDGGASGPGASTWLGAIGRSLLSMAWDRLAHKNSQVVWHKDDIYPGFDPVEWKKYGDDGLVSVYSQRHPMNSSAKPLAPPSSGQKIEPGVWHYRELPVDHLGVVPFPTDEHMQKQFFFNFFQMLHCLPEPSQQ